MEKFLLFVKLICVKMSAQSLIMRILYLHSASFLISHSKALLWEIWWKLAWVHSQHIGNHYVKCIQLLVGRPQGKGFHSWSHIGITWKTLKFWFQVSLSGFWFNWSGMQSVIWDFWKLSKWLIGAFFWLPWDSRKKAPRLKETGNLSEM